MPASCLIRFPIRRFTDYWKDATITGGPSYVHYAMGSPSPSLVPRNGPEASASPPVCGGFFLIQSLVSAPPFCLSSSPSLIEQRIR